MSTKTKWTAIRLTLEGLLVVVFIVLAVSRYEQQLLAINWKLVSFASLAVAGAFAIYRWQLREDNTFDLLDTFMSDRKADPDKLFKWVFAALSFWVVVYMVLADKDVTALLTIVLGSFVAGAAANKFSDALARRGPPVDQSQNVNAQAGAKVEMKQSPPAQEEGPSRP